MFGALSFSRLKIEDHKSTFDAKQQFSQETLNGDWYERSATQTANSKHTASGTFASTFVETNLLHIHSEVEEISKYAHKIYGHEEQHLEENKDKPGRPASACCACKIPHAKIYANANVSGAAHACGLVATSRACA